MPVSGRLTRAVIAITALLLTGATAFPGVAAAADIAGNPNVDRSVSAEPPADRFERAERVCDVYIKRVSTTSDETKVVADSCSTDPTLRSAAQARKTQRAPVVVLVEFWSLPDFNGLVDRVFGDSGPCDALGYSMRNLDLTNSRIGGIRSYITGNSCSGQKIYTNRNFQGNLAYKYGYSIDWVGPYHDGSVHSMKVYRFYG